MERKGRGGVRQKEKRQAEIQRDRCDVRGLTASSKTYAPRAGGYGRTVVAPCSNCAAERKTLDLRAPIHATEAGRQAGRDIGREMDRQEGRQVGRKAGRRIEKQRNPFHDPFIEPPEGSSTKERV